MAETFAFTVNGQKKEVATEPDRPLLDVLREDLGLTGTKYGCGEAKCGACSVLLDGKRVFSCQTHVSLAQGKAVTTIEGLAVGNELHRVQDAFLAECAYQCGYCTPGMIMCAVDLLNETPKPTDEQIITGMTRNLCRCCGYPKIFSAVRRAADKAPNSPVKVEVKP